MRARAGAERQAHADLALPRARPGQHEVGGVAADGEQQEEHDPLQDPERAASMRCGPRGACQNGSTSACIVAFVSG